MRIGPVLILSTDSDTQDLYVSALRSRRRPVYGIASAEEAVALAALGPAAIVVDVRCERDWEQCHQLRHSLTTCDVPLVVITGYVARDGRFRQRAASVGCAAFLAKPSLPDVVERTVDRVTRGERGIQIMTMDDVDHAEHG